MADFNAGQKVPVVNFNFAPYAEWAGELTEPSFKQINDFRRVVGDLIEKAASQAPDGDLTKLTAKEQLELMSQMLNADNSTDQVVVVSAVANLTGLDRPKFEDLPWRIQQAFFGHLVQEYLSPEAPGTDATS